MKKAITRLDYCQDLLVSPINDTLTHFAEPSEIFSHDAINRYWQSERLTPRLGWDNTAPHLLPTQEGYVIFDDPVLDKNYSVALELVRRQDSGNPHSVIKGIGVVTCIDVNPSVNRFWLIDYRLYDPEGDGKSKLEHVRDMLINLHDPKQLPFVAGLMEPWYATKAFMLLIESWHKIYYCPLKDNRHVEDSGRTRPDRRVDTWSWNQSEPEPGKVIKIKGFPKDHQVRCFWVEVSTPHTDWIVTNDSAQNSTEATQPGCGFRWKIEPRHREGKQLTGLERGPGRKSRIQRHHIACALLGWVKLNEWAYQSNQTVYQLKHGLLHNYLCQQLKHPSLKRSLA